MEDEETEEEIRRLYDREHENLLRMDIEAQARFMPDDFVVTNPFNMFIDKQQVIERLRANIIKYNTYERQYDYFRRYGDVGIMVGNERVVPTPDADRPDAGETIHRRFTEVWVQETEAGKRSPAMPATSRSRSLCTAEYAVVAHTRRRL